MKFLIDKSPDHVHRKFASDLVCGQLLTPCTRYTDWGGAYAIDNGAYSGLRHADFAALIARQKPHKERCLFVAIPDVVGSARRTLELWQHRNRWARSWPMALVAQDGIEDMPIPWESMAAVFIGGTNQFKDSSSAYDVVKTAKALGVHVHVGRINTPKRYQIYADLGADTCDGTGVSRYDWMLDAIERGEEPRPLLESCYE